MAKLYLKFEQTTLKELTLSHASAITIGRLPDNLLQVDNLAVSGHHAKIYWDAEHYVIEDNNSLNGTYVNNQRVSKQMLKDNDGVLIGKHTIVFKDEAREDPAMAEKKMAPMPALPKMEATVVLDTKKAKELLAQARAAQGAAAGASADVPTPRVPTPAPGARTSGSTPPAISSSAAHKERTGKLTVLEGKADQADYLLNSKLTVIGGSKMATVKLKGSMFKSAPDVAAMVSKREDKYFVAPQDKKANLKINGSEVTHQQELNEGDVMHVCGVKLAFSYQE